MDITKEILTVHVPKELTIFDWSRGIGKSVIFPELLVGCEELLYSDLDKVHCMKVITNEFDINKDPVDFVVRRNGVKKTLQRILEWSLSQEEYLMCARVVKLQNIVNTNETTND